MEFGFVGVFGCRYEGMLALTDGVDLASLAGRGTAGGNEFLGGDSLTQQNSESGRVDSLLRLPSPGNGWGDFSNDEPLSGNETSGPGTSCHFLGRVSFLGGLAFGLPCIFFGSTLSSLISNIPSRSARVSRLVLPFS